MTLNLYDDATTIFIQVPDIPHLLPTPQLFLATPQWICMHRFLLWVGYLHGWAASAARIALLHTPSVCWSAAPLPRLAPSRVLNEAQVHESAQHLVTSPIWLTTFVILPRRALTVGAL